MAGKAGTDSLLGFRQPSGKTGILGLGEEGKAVLLLGTEGDRLFWEIEAELKAKENTSQLASRQIVYFQVQ